MSDQKDVQYRRSLILMELVQVLHTKPSLMLQGHFGKHSSTNVKSLGGQGTSLHSDTPGKQKCSILRQ